MTTFTRRDKEQVSNPPDAILTSDWHIREDIPECRTDDFFATQERKLEWLKALQQKYSCPVFDGGDMFDHWKPSPYLLQWTMKHMPANVWTVPGNHDLAQHSMELFDKSGLAVLFQSGAIHIPTLYQYTGKTLELAIMALPWNTSEKQELDKSKVNILLTHEYVWLEKPNIPKILGRSAREVTDEYGDLSYSLVVSGDHHKSFEYRNKRNGCLLVNPGCIMRQSAEEIDYQPRVALWWASDNRIEWIPIPIEKEAVTRAHLDTKDEREDRIDSFVARMKKDFEVELSFERNMESYLAKNRTHPEVVKLLNKVMETK